MHLKLHPKKIYLQHYSKGVHYLGGFIKPNRIYVSKRTKGNFYQTISKQNKRKGHLSTSKAEKRLFLSTMNSYLDVLRHLVNMLA